MEVLMAGVYSIPEGKKVDFSYDLQKNLYMASCDEKVFGLANSIKGKSKISLMKLGTEFSGCVVKSCPSQRRLTVKIKLKGGGK